MNIHKKTSLSIIIIFCIHLSLFQQLHAEALHFIAYGDTRGNIDTMEKPQIKHDTIAKVIRGRTPDIILFSGDMVYYNEFEKFTEVVRNNYTKDKPIPFYPVIGNHELIFGNKIDALMKELLSKIKNHEENTKSAHSSHTETPPVSLEMEKIRDEIFNEIYSIPEEKLKERSRQVLEREFMDKLAPEYPGYLKETFKSATRHQSWYSFIKETDGHKIKFIALNSSLPDDTEQYQWFLRELKEFNGPKIVCTHYPPYTIGFHGCSDILDKTSPLARFRNRYAKVFNEPSNNIIMVISGHDHNYQRICKTDTKGNVQLPVYIISGGGGAHLSGRGECDITQIPLDDFKCAIFETAYQFFDVTVLAENEKSLIFNCAVLGIKCDLTKELPDDASFKTLFVKEKLQVIDRFSIAWQK
ncbi:MAG: hypothetical protein FJ264_06695 [Planctomycetes bacterium]|nr:hypothetical protein [Planctomycetota bacterium]